ncbi:Ornithine decarboxylase [Parasponia andersonii]|uniref:ornithine decarboxylase n=1 Tax=Parasponia andersonii TaxID=3476 RepID=A0A2P5CHU3_PARAD|nr:Ornithine decarboxylase [Parasponia andersonii]
MGSETVSNPRSLQDVSGAPGLRGQKVTTIQKDGLISFMQSIVLNTQLDSKEPFYVLDLGTVVSLIDQWARALPSVRPFYAVKCNPDPALLGAMAALGSGFDCASQAEIESVLGLGVSPDRIIFANPCKTEAHIKYAASVGVNLTTFDSVDEVEKIRKWHPKCDLLIRIKAPDDSRARCPLGPKYGALPEEVEPLLRAAQAAGLTVSGVSFHIGSGATHSSAYRGAIGAAKSVFQAAARLGLPEMWVLNIGGGFTAGQPFEEAASNVREALQAHFPKAQGRLSLIAEPGRFFAESAFTLAANVIGKRVRGELREYWINDGIYGSMNCLLYDHATLKCVPMACSSKRANPTCEGAITYSSTVFGPTCDALDTVLTGHWLPELQVNDWLLFPNMGAYTMAAGSNFNGFNTSAILTYLAYSNPS